MPRKRRIASGGDIPPDYDLQPGERIERQELHCHNCDQYVQFDVDMSLNGNHVLECPNCGHEHCRVVRDGRISDDRWDQRNRNSYTVSTRTMTTSTVSTYDTTTSAGIFLYQQWTSATASSYSLASST